MIEGPVRRVEASAASPLGLVQAVRDRWSAPIDSIGRPDRHWLQLSLLPLPRSARGCFPEQWGPHRYEPIGEIFLLPAGRTVRARSDCREQRAIVCGFRPDAIARWLGDDVAWTDARLSGALDIAAPPLRPLMLRLEAELAAPGFASEMLVELLMGQIVIELGRHVRAIGEEPASGGLAPWRLRLIEERLATPGSPSLDELAQLCGLSVRQLARGFRASRGRSIGVHVAARRIEAARRQLAEGQSVKAIAHALGFASPSNFSNAFRRATGETPRRFRERTRSSARPPVH